jgi:galactokinase
MSQVLIDNAPRTFRAPGRVNLIGEHTDYNDGFVMPATIDLSTYVRVWPRDDRKLQIRAEKFDEQVEFDLDEPHPAPRGVWGDYVIGVAIMLESAGHRLRGAFLQIRSEVPVGSGLSSSAAVEVATACALTGNSQLKIDRRELALLCQKAENEFVGARVGVMDQFVALFGQAQRALLLDCRSLDFKLLPLPDTVNVVICNTMVKHALASSAYNERRAQCEDGVKRLARHLPGVKALRDVEIEQLEQFRSELGDVVYRRCLHVITENARVLSAAEALEKGDVSSFGELMDESHRSLRDDYEVSSRELNLMVDLARKNPGVFGARMMGGGFGGSTVNLVDANHIELFKYTMTKEYERIKGWTPEIYVCEVSGGAEEI